MKVTREKTENAQAYLTVEMDPAEVEESIEKSFRRLVRTKKVPGFRVGKTPRSIFEKYYSRESLLDDALDTLLPEAYKKAIQEQEIEPIANPQIELTQTEPVIFKAVVPLKPTVKLGDYHQIRIETEAPKEISEKDIDDVIEALRHQNATWEPADDKEVTSGNLLTLDIWSNVEDKPYINQKGAQFQATAGATFPVAGFVEQLFGMKKDEEKDFELEFPKDDPRTDYAGKTGKFKVRINGIKEEKLPEINEDFAKQIGEEFTTVESLKEKISANLKERAEDDRRLAYEDNVLEAASGQSEIEFPEVLVDSEIHRIIDQRFRTRQEFEAYLQNVGKTEEEVHSDLHEELTPVATTRVKRALMLGKVAEEEKLEVSDSEVDSDIERMLESTTSNKEALEKSLNNPEVRESIHNSLLTRKTIERLVQIAKGEEVEANAQKEETK